MHVLQHIIYTGLDKAGIGLTRRAFKVTLGRALKSQFSSYRPLHCALGSVQSPGLVLHKAQWLTL